MAADYASLAIDFVSQHFLELGVLFAVIFGVFFLSKTMRKVPPIPDYMKIFEEKAVKDEKFNVPDNMLGVKWLYRGGRFVGKICTYSRQTYEVALSPDVDSKKYRAEKDFTSNDLVTITFKRPMFGKYFFIGKAFILRFTVKEATHQNARLIFPSDTNFTALGNEYMTLGSYQVTSRIVEDNWNKRLYEGSTNAFANQMLKVAGYITEFAQERKIKELEIEKMKAEKQLKMGQLI